MPGGGPGGFFEPDFPALIQLESDLAFSSRPGFRAFTQSRKWPCGITHYAASSGVALRQRANPTAITVTPTECRIARQERSRVTEVQPSDRIFNAAAR